MIIPAGTANATLILTSEVDPDEMVITMGLLVPGGEPDPSDIEDFYLAWQAMCGPFCSEVINATVLRIYMSPDDGGNILEFSFGLGGFGTRSGDVLPNNSALIVRKATGLGGRKHRGRFFLPGTMITDTEANLVKPSVRSDFDDASATFMAAFPFGTITAPCLLHTDPATFPDSISSFGLADRLGTMRHRYRN